MMVWVMVLAQSCRKNEKRTKTIKKEVQRNLRGRPTYKYDLSTQMKHLNLRLKLVAEIARSKISTPTSKWSTVMKMNLILMN